MSYIFVHGLGQNPSSWNEVISRFSSDVQANCIDLSSLSNGGDTTYENLYSVFEEHCNKNAKPLSICGISLGAVLALNYAMEHSQKVDSLILIAPQYKMPRVMLKIQNAVFNLMPKKSFQKTGFSKKSIIQLTTSMMNLDFSDSIKDVALSTLIICGERDKANIRAAKDLANHIPNTILRLVENAGHEVNLDAPEQLAAAIKEFWKDCR